MKPQKNRDFGLIFLLTSSTFGYVVFQFWDCVMIYMRTGFMKMEKVGFPINKQTHSFHLNGLVVQRTVEDLNLFVFGSKSSLCQCFLSERLHRYILSMSDVIMNMRNAWVQKSPE